MATKDLIFRGIGQSSIPYFLTKGLGNFVVVPTLELSISVIDLDAPNSDMPFTQSTATGTSAASTYHRDWPERIGATNLSRYYLPMSDPAAATGDLIDSPLSYDGTQKLTLHSAGGVYSDLYHVSSTGLRIDPRSSALGIAADPIGGICERIGGKLQIDTVDALATTATTFLTRDSNVVKSRTPAEVLTDIGAQPAITWPATSYLLKSAGTGTVPVASALYDNGNVYHNVSFGDIDFYFEGKTQEVFRLDAGTDSLWFGDSNGSYKFIGFGNAPDAPDAKLYSDNVNLVTAGASTAKFELLGYGTTPSEYTDFYHVGSTGLRINQYHSAIGLNADPITGVQLRVGGKLQIDTIDADANPATTFLTTVSGVVQSRTAAQVLSDIGAAASGNISGTQNYLAKFGATGATVGNSQLVDDGTDVTVNTGNFNLQNVKYLRGKATTAAYRTLIGLDGSNILKIGQDTDIAAVTFGTTSELARLNSSGLGVGVTPSSSYWIYGVKNRNSGTINRIENTTNGSSAYTGMEICGDSGNNILLYQNSSSTTGTYCGLSNNGLSYISSTNVSGFIINSAGNTPLHLASYGRIGITIIANGTLPNIGFGCTPSVMLHAESATTTSMLLKNTGNAGVQLSFDANLSAADASIGYIPYKWNGTAVAAIDCSTGADTMNKDDGYLIFKTATGGSLTQKMLLGYQLPIVELGNPATEDDAAVWANTQTVLRVGTGLSILDFQSIGISYPELLWNAQCSNPGITYKARQTGRSYRLRGDCANNTGVLSIDFVANQTAGDTLTWLTALNIGIVSLGAAIRHNPNSSDIDFAFYGDNRQVAQLDAGTDSFQFFDYNGVAAQWFATATPTNGFLRFNANKSLYFNTECQMFADGTYMYIQGNNLPDDAHKVTNYLYRDNGGYIKVA